MAGIDTVTTFFDQLDNMEAEFRLHNLGYLVRILQIECHIRIFRYQLSPAHKAEFTTTAARTFIFRIQTCQSGESYFTGSNTFRIVTQSLLHTLNFFLRNLRFHSNDLHFYLSRNKRNTVLRKILEITTDFGRSNLDIPHNLLLHFLHRFSITYILAEHFAYLCRSLIIIFFYFFLRTNLINQPICTSFHITDNFLFGNLNTINSSLMKKQFLDGKLLRNNTIRITVKLAAFILGIQTFILHVRF